MVVVMITFVPCRWCFALRHNSVLELEVWTKNTFSAIFHIVFECLLFLIVVVVRPNGDNSCFGIFACWCLVHIFTDFVGEKKKPLMAKHSYWVLFYKWRSSHWRWGNALLLNCWLSLSYTFMLVVEGQLRKTNSLLNCGCYSEWVNKLRSKFTLRDKLQSQSIARKSLCILKKM